MMPVNEPFVIGILVTFVIGLVTGLVKRSSPLVRVVGVLLLNWAAGTVFTEMTRITDGWWFNIIIDIVAAMVVLWRPAGVWQGAIGISYCIQLIMHAGYGAHYVLPDLFPSAPDKYVYYEWLTNVAWLQLALVWGWSGVAWGGGLVHRGSADRGKAHPAALNPRDQEP